MKKLHKEEKILKKLRKSVISYKKPYTPVWFTAYKHDSK